MKKVKNRGGGIRHGIIQDDAAQMKLFPYELEEERKKDGRILTKREMCLVMKIEGSTRHLLRC